MLIKQRRKLFRLHVPRSLKFVYVHRKGIGLFANRNFKKGETLIRFNTETVIVTEAKASPEAVQMGEDRFFDTKWLVPEAFINHSCSPNARLDGEGKQYVAIKTIKKNEEIAFNYLTTEWDMADVAFICRCSAKYCYGTIKGFKYLTHEQQEELKPSITPFLLSKYESNRRNQSAD